MYIVYILPSSLALRLLSSILIEIDWYIIHPIKPWPNTFVRPQCAPIHFLFRSLPRAGPFRPLVGSGGRRGKTWGRRGEDGGKPHQPIPPHPIIQPEIPYCRTPIPTPGASMSPPFGGDSITPSAIMHYITHSFTLSHLFYIPLLIRSPPTHPCMAGG